ncbi:MULTISPECIES: DUF2235 domain-containing protein [unclassified Janthinobacterium]|uniref:phospholipase effector Tle1 domain-containing protein n=1 Tax=unclassified Janthinobacterium TaxID=2610881 RepID=UPI0016225282|nr:MULTISPECIES: DUF2235 domain-containing protein [unclassified Janthinobacterium]MBB5609917.1 uncharacterized protein (DUF2235 family) [Janthinobacterium sp. S3T4]MBB5615064.1 uncharacterized protein (DUF2235 family) [Janthinobacterium sp. S3M3]
MSQHGLAQLVVQRVVQACLGVGMAMLLAACATPGGDTAAPAVTEKVFAGDPATAKNIFVFLDGTRNDIASNTNVRKVFEAVAGANDMQTSAIYIEGVGSVESPVLGASLGLGMEPRILRGYDFISQAFRPGDRVFIIGFSRGAHQARALAGLIAYAGVPARSTDDLAARLKRGNAILEIVKRKNDEAYLARWQAWRPGQAPMLGQEIYERLSVSTSPVEIDFLGVWDTVPGSLFKHFGTCKEQSDSRDGDRYKSDSYPPIHRILHAVALDEKRSRFHPILLCPAINPAFTTVNELWFPGAHADVGGGYADSQALSDLPLQWMSAGLVQSFAPLPPPSLRGDPLGLAHWSVGDRPANLFSQCEDRTPPPAAVMDVSAKTRITAGSAPLRIHGVTEQRPYPLLCPR